MKKSTRNILIIVLSFLIVILGVGAYFIVRWIKAPDYKLEFNIGDENLVLNTNLNLDNLVSISGGNITSRDYTIKDNSIIFSSVYLTSVNDKNTTYTIKTTTDCATVLITQNIANKENQIINGSFETGDLQGWTVKKLYNNRDDLSAFSADGIKKNDNYFINIPYNGSGKYVYGFNDDLVNDGYSNWGKKKGCLVSSDFVVSGSGYITFRLGGCENTALNYISIKDEQGIELYRFSNIYLNKDNKPSLVNYKADIHKAIGKKVYIEICDYSSSINGFMTFDDFITFYPNEPSGFTLCPNILPYIAYEKDAPAYLQGGDFSQGLDEFVLASGKDVFKIDNGVLKSNGQGDMGKGVLRTSAFKLQGKGFLSFSLGAGCGSDAFLNTCIMVKKVQTNEVVAVCYNNYNNKEFMVDYCLDLQDQINNTLYLEIVDDAIDAYGVIFIDNIVTYYEDYPKNNFLWIDNLI